MQTSKIKLYNIASAKTGSILTPLSEFSVDYPISYFTVENKKPTLCNYKNKDGKGISDIRSAIIASIKGSVQPELAVEFLVHYLKTIKIQLSKDWKSYNTVIGKEGDQITPLDLVSLVNHEYSLKDVSTNTTESNPEQDLPLAFLLLAVYRLARATDETYRKNLMKSLDTGYKGLSHRLDGITVSSLTVAKSVLPVDKEFRKVVACVDMFFSYFKDHPLGVLKLCTTGSRHRDCAALQVFCFTSNLLGVSEYGELALWMMHQDLAKEISRMFLSEENEYSTETSYFPYQIDFGIVRSSAYSAKANPGVHFLCNLIGALEGRDRCRHARMLLAKSVMDICKCGLLITYAYKTVAKLQLAFVDATDKTPDVLKALTDNVNASAAAEDEDGDVGTNPEPRNRQSEKWFFWFECLDFKPTKQMKDQWMSVQSTIQSPRGGSIGEWIKNYDLP